MSFKVIGIVLVGGALGACSKTEAISEGPRPTTTQTPLPVDPPAPAASAMDAGREEDTDLVVPSDLEEKAKEEISATNLEKQLDALEKEIGSGE
jgi:hypothetical protein